MKSIGKVRRDGERIPVHTFERDMAMLRELHAQLAASGLTRDELEQLRAARATIRSFRYRSLGKIFGRLERDKTWLTEIDFKRWYELGCRERIRGLTRAEGAEVLEFRRLYREALDAGRDPMGERFIVHYEPIRYADGEDG